MMEGMTSRGLAERNVPEGSDENTSELRRTIGVLFEPGDVVELRALKDAVVASGYFDIFEELAEQAAKLDGRGFAVYATLNPTEPALLARSRNRIKPHPKATTSDTNITRRRWLPVDVDPVRPANVSSTDDEKHAAVHRAREVRDFLGEQGWPEPVVGDSGNGAHLLYRVDLPNDRDSLELVKGVLEALAFRFSDEAVSVDKSTANAARIWKLYGTTARKGDDTEDRPHRRSRLLEIPKEVEACRP
jgi:hypothetical protein